MAFLNELKAIRNDSLAILTCPLSGRLLLYNLIRALSVLLILKDKEALTCIWNEN